MCYYYSYNYDLQIRRKPGKNAKRKIFKIAIGKEGARTNGDREKNEQYQDASVTGAENAADGADGGKTGSNIANSTASNTASKTAGNIASKLASDSGGRSGGFSGTEKDVFGKADDFWSLEDMLPPVKPRGRFSGISLFDTESVDVISEPQNDAGTAHGTGITPEDDVKTGAGSGEKIPPRGENGVDRGIRYSSDRGGSDHGIGCRDGSDRVGSDENSGGTGNFESWLEKRREYEKKRYIYGKSVTAEYVPDSPLIKKVTVSVDTGRRMPYERFPADAERLRTRTGEFRGNVPFSSYYPQFCQLSAEQTECYIGFRTCVLSGTFPDVDKAYIYLLLYETICLSSIYPPEKADRISRLICGYPDCDAKMFTDMVNWLSDVCLIYREKIPERIFGKVYPRVLSVASVKEFYLFGSSGGEVSSERALMMIAGRYDYAKSRFYEGNEVYFDRYIPEAVCFAIKKLAETDSRFSGEGAEVCTLIHESYFGALCTASVRKTIALECVCLTRSDAVRRTVTDLIKYAENCLRARLGIPNRLTTSYLSLEVKDMIKKWFSERSEEFRISSDRRKKKEEVAPGVPEYEKFYEPKESGISFDLADEIERSSWDVTEKLISAFGGETEEEKTLPGETGAEKTNERGSLKNSRVDHPSGFSENAPENAGENSTEYVAENAPEDTPENVIENTSGNPILSALKALLAGDSAGFRRTAEREGIFEEELYERVNEWSLENDDISDVVLCEEDGGYGIIPDYYEVIKDITDGVGGE